MDILSQNFKSPNDRNFQFNHWTPWVAHLLVALRDVLAAHGVHDFLLVLLQRQIDLRGAGDRRLGAKALWWHTCEGVCMRA